LTFRLLVDRTGVELFVGDGEAVMTANAYPDKAADGVRFFAEKGEARFKNVVGYELEVN